MRKLLGTLLLSCVLSGCIITQQNELHDIIKQNHQTYLKYEKVKFNNVSAILKNFSNVINSKKYRNFQELEKEKEIFIENLSTKPISSNYPIVASPNEIIIIKRYLRDVFHFIKAKDISSHQFQMYINKASTIFVTELMTNEKKIYQ
jgi:hypothetical protein